MIFLIKNLSLAFFSVIGISLYFNVPRNTIISCGVCGAVGWTVYRFVQDILMLGNLGALFGALSLGLMAGYFARKHKLPTTNFLLAGIVPLVPGLSVYYMMYYTVFKDYEKVFEHGLNAAIISGLLAVGVYISSSISDKIKKSKALRVKLKEKVK